MSRGNFRSSPYLTWAKAHHEVSFNLASSGVAAPSIEDLGLTTEDWSLTEEHEDGWLPLMERIAARYEVEPSQVALAQGASMANHLVCALLLNPGDHVLVETPFYEPLHLVPRFFHAEVDFFERSREADFRLESKHVEAKLGEKTRLVILSNLHNPTGQHASAEELESFAELAERRDFHVLIDEVYLEWLYDEGERTAASLSPHIVTTRSLTKAYGLDAARAGWILAEESIAERLRRLMDLYSVKMAHPSERLAARALDRANAILGARKESLRSNAELVDRFIREHQALSWIRPRAGSVGFVYWSDASRGDVDRLIELLELRDALVAPGHFFGIPNGFRMGFGMKRETLVEGLSRLRDALTEV